MNLEQVKKLAKKQTAIFELSKENEHFRAVMEDVFVIGFHHGQEFEKTKKSDNEKR